ncbi:bifunctional phosphopantothenoylcysteine decarboxylase/phosphopantothenate--cysteine ligase CoaBC [Paludibacter sp. 221]|uniref:bifunctional phosphopantothenoylcysteine decarboxylase/phosphopantothenate--cysteine ligase CoaBC n=1 Tax=Paludibacter sp. 221 TaxID=2302939 RepID=UPI0013D7A9D5|nr:bifunctional phosphopantothenoylcysteine decarboxylase/phosphopantothenate--cysteine ligase CoaBC [Paludibacter sp. 221]NDV47444.1 bifunctional phosphopantothenoylcysteine decarboxylase/phosphopantothenate--cysteine ligase CoaBC [Paludibacter sp. 221]
MLRGKKIILGITGSIAAYKSAQLIRLLVKEGAEVKVIMTPLAKEFITPLTLATLAKNPILVDFFDPTNGNWNSHVSLGLWADAYVIAPATANTIGKMANGVADNLLLTTYLSAKCPVFVAPAMDLDMFAHTATQRNIKALLDVGNHVIEPAAGELASGLDGKGRMEEPENIVRYLDDFFTPKTLSGKKILITAGPTYEKIDPVRFVGNHSSGKMGFAIAEELGRRGADVTLITGPVQLKTVHRNITRIDVQSAEEMYNAVTESFNEMAGAVLCAAVADFTPVENSDIKLKRGKDALKLELKPTKDIAAHLGTTKRDNQFLVGFALETNNEEQNALEKMERKNLDFIVLNSLKDDRSCFGYDTNKITILNRSGSRKQFDLKSKVQVAEDIVDEIESLF